MVLMKTSGGIITCSHASTCLHVVFFWLNVYFFKINKKRGCPDPPPFVQIRNGFRQKRGYGRRFGTDLAVSNIWISGHLDT
jgi:hypothetical protein